MYVTLGDIMCMNKVSAKDYYTNSRLDVFTRINNSVNSVLDIGCGEGLFLLNFKKVNSSVETWGVEPVASVVENAKHNVDTMLTGTLKETVDQLPINHFELITFNDVLEHLTYPWDELRLIKPLLKEKGVVVSSIPNVRFYTNIFNMIVKKDWQYEDAGILDRTHFRFFTKKSMVRLFEESGYEVLSIEGINGPRKLPKRIIAFILDCLTFFFLEDVKYTQYLVTARPRI